MPWARAGDTAANHPIVLGVLEHEDVDDRLLNETFGFVVRCATQSAAHLTDYVINRGTAIQMAGMARADFLLNVAIFAGYMTQIQIDADGGTRKAYKLVDDPEFIHMRTKEEIDWERQRKNDNSNPALIVPVRWRDGDACRYCLQVVNWKARTGRLAATYDHLKPGYAETPDDIVVACGACNQSKGRRDLDEVQDRMTLKPEPASPYYSPSTVAWFDSNEWARRHGYTGLKAPAREFAPGQPVEAEHLIFQQPGNGQLRPGNNAGKNTGKYTKGNGSTTRPEAEQAPPKPEQTPAEAEQTPPETAANASGPEHTEPRQAEPQDGTPPEYRRTPQDPAGHESTKASRSGTGRDGTGRDGTGRNEQDRKPSSQTSHTQTKSARRRRPRRRGGKNK